MPASPKLVQFVQDMQKNPARALAYGSLVVGGLLLLVIFSSIIGAVTSSSGNTTIKVAEAPVGSDVSMYGGALKIRVTGVQKRPLSAFGPVSADDARVAMVALQIDAEVSFFRQAWANADTIPANMKAVLPVPESMVLSGVDKNGDAGSWSDFVTVQGQSQTDLTVYDLQDSVLPPDTVKLPGSFVFKVPIDATHLVLTIKDYGQGGKPGSGTPVQVYNIPLDVLPAAGS